MHISVYGAADTNYPIIHICVYNHIVGIFSADILTRVPPELPIRTASRLIAQMYIYFSQDAYMYIVNLLGTTWVIDVSSTKQQFVVCCSLRLAVDSGATADGGNGTDRGRIM